MTELGIAAPAVQVRDDPDRDGRGRDDAGRDGPAGGPGWDDEAGRPAGFAGVVQAFDERVDRWFEPLRGAPALDGLAKLITGLGDHGLMWTATTVWRARHSGPERARAVRALAIAGVESSIVNRTLKSVVGRSRPDRAGLQLTQGGIPVREPTTSSFPSGHTLAAFCAATVMSQRHDRAGNALLFSSAALVGVSRLHLRAHHASDVLGGAAIGAALGLIGRRLV
ncbi:MAG TPA: phosphatase PAP2 family protein [Acidimicrobiales bacterium]|nr:phosphatase PAP2 family protein [Acidimicrobiales bacterium]